ncbi:MAG TPA: hypothetical protein VFL42_11935 [Terriglobales bacterium]|nr:hypothetical protein [Terriglobales bacterium]
MSEENTIPTKPEIDSLAQLYLDADAAVEQARTSRSLLAGRLAEMIVAHGFLPRRAAKSRRIEGEEFQATLSRGHSLEVNGTEVLRLRMFLTGTGMGGWFRKLFKREPVYVLREGAQELVARLLAKGAPSDLQILFSNSLSIRDNSASLKVERIKQEKVEKKKEAKAS